MERWWTKEEVPKNRAYLRMRMLAEMDFSDFGSDTTETVLRLATRGKVKIGEVDRQMVLRSAEQVRHPNRAALPLTPALDFP